MVILIWSFVIYLCMCLTFHKRVELAEKEGFPESKRAREKPFRMFKHNRMMTVKLTNLKEGWNFDNTEGTQVNCNLCASRSYFLMK